MLFPGFYLRTKSRYVNHPYFYVNLILPSGPLTYYHVYPGLGLTINSGILSYGFNTGRLITLTGPIKPAAWGW